MTLAMPDWLAAGSGLDSASGPQDGTTDGIQAAVEWVDGHLDRLGLRRTGAIEEVKARPWSLVWQIPTADGPVWFKANGGDTRYEAALAEALADWAPGRVPRPLAVDTVRGWQLTPDAGITLRSTTAVADIRAWEHLVASYARLQLDLAGHVEDMIGLGVPDHRPARLTDLTRTLVTDPGLALTDTRRRELTDLLTEYEQWCAHLTASGVPASLNHDDLHDGNVLVRPGSEDDLIFFDWGDSAVAFPFTTLLITLRVVALRFELAPDDPQVLRVRDAYLEAYECGLSRDDARRLAKLATWTGKPGRALSWRRALTTADAAELAEHGDAVAGWLEELLTPGPL